MRAGTLAVLLSTTLMLAACQKQPAQTGPTTGDGIPVGSDDNFANGSVTNDVQTNNE